MSYNDNSENFLKNLTAENCPVRWFELAQHYRNDLDSLNREEKALYSYIINNFLVEDSENKTVAGSTGTFVETNPALPANTIGNVSIAGTDEFDWTTTPQDFTVDGTTVTLDTLATGLTEVVAEINSSISTAGISGVEAFESGNYVGLRSIDSGSSASFTVGAGTTNSVLSALGLSAGTYTGVDATGNTEFKPSFGNVGVKESSFIVEVDGSVTPFTLVSTSPLTIRMSGDLTGATEVVFKATNPLTTKEKIKEGFQPLQPYLYNKGE